MSLCQPNSFENRTFDSTELLLNRVLQLSLITVVSPELLERFKIAQFLERHRKLCHTKKHKDGTLPLTIT